MTYNPAIHHRRSIRLRGYDYSRAGLYFVTICTQGRRCLFGDIADGTIQCTAAGEMVRTVWGEIPSHYPGVEIDQFVTMPNHIHGIIVIVGAGPRACPAPDSDPRAYPDDMGQPCTSGQTCQKGQPRGVAPTGYSLPDVVHRFKTMTTKKDGRGKIAWVATLRQKIMATQLLGTYHP